MQPAVNIASKISMKGSALRIGTILALLQPLAANPWLAPLAWVSALTYAVPLAKRIRSAH